MYKTMRRTDREVSEKNQIREIMKECEIVKYAMKDGDGIYIVPLHFGIAGTTDEPVLYSHSAGEGHKIDLIEENGYAAFEMECGVELQTNEKACGFSSSFKSVIGEGKISIVSDTEEKKKGLLSIMEHYTGKDDWDFPEKSLGAVKIIKMEITDMTCKVHD